MNGKTLALWGTWLVALGLGSAGCSSGGRGGSPAPVPTSTAATLTEADTREVLAATTLVSESSNAPLCLALNELSPGNFPTTDLGATTVLSSVSGATTSGTVAVDFGVGTTVGGATFTGSLEVTFSGSGSSGLATMVFTNFGATSGAGSVLANGTLTWVLSYSGGNATAVLSGSLTIQRGADTITISLNQTIDIEGATGRAVVAGTTAVTHSRLGVWVINLAGVTVEQLNGAREIVAGTIQVVRTSPIPTTAVYVFTSAGSGSFTVSPLGLSGSFSL